MSLLRWIKVGVAPMLLLAALTTGRWDWIAPARSAHGPAQAMGAHYYAAPWGEPGGDGSPGRPWDLATALAQPEAVRPGDTIWLRGGTYRGSFVSRLTGFELAPVIVRQYPGERVVIDGFDPAAKSILEVRGSWTIYMGFEVMSSNPVRVGSANIGPQGVYVYGPHTKLVNLIVHDTETGIGLWEPAEDAEVYGCLIFNNGHQGPDRAWGPGIYTQNEVGTKRIVDNLVFNQFNHGLQVYGSDAASVIGFHIEGNTIFNNGYIGSTHAMNIVLGSGQPSERITLLNNYTYAPDTRGTNLFLGFSDALHKDLSLQGNYLVGGGPVLWLTRWEQVVASGNTLSGEAGLINVMATGGREIDSRPPVGRGRSVNNTPSAVVNEMALQTGGTLGQRWENNTYYFLGGGTTGPFRYQSRAVSFSGDLSAWSRATGFDQDSRYWTSRPTGQAVFVRPNLYEAGRANITVYNWALGDAARVTVPGLKLGQRFEIRDAQNYFGRPVVSGTYDGKLMTIPLTGAAQATPLIGADHPGNEQIKQPAHTGKEFHVFVVVPR